jgi:pilus assembly protein CpaF
MNVEVIIDSQAGGRRIERFIDDHVLSIGRTSQCSVCVVDDLISRQHALVHLEAGGLRVVDLSRNGTIAGGPQLNHASIDVPFGTPSTVGTYTLMIRPEGEPAESAPRLSVAASLTAASPQSAKRAASDGAPSALPSREEEAVLRREIHRQLLHHLDLAGTDVARLDDPSFRPRVLAALRRIIKNLESRLPAQLDQDDLIGQMADEALGLGPLEYLLADPSVSEIMVIDADTIYVEKSGRIVRSAARFTDDDRVRAVIERIVTPLGRRIDESSPLVDARLPDGSRVNAIIRPLALKGSCITVRKFARVPLTLEKLYDFGALTPAMGRFLTRSVISKCNIVISGGTGSGKTTLLNVLSSAIPSDERIVTIEDSAELQLAQPHVVALETRPPNMEGKGEYTIRDLVRNALRMRPDRIVVGECRGGEALDMLQAMNTGHDGSLTTTHANSPAEALSRLETLVLMAGVELPSRAIREQIGSSVHLIVQQSRLADGTRKVVAISELCGLDQNGEFELRPIFRFQRSGTGSQGEVLGKFAATGYLPSFLQKFIVMGLIGKGEAYL